jgi:hypothetical protein
MLFQSWGDVGRVAVVAEGVRTVADNGPSASMGEAMSPPILVNREHRPPGPACGAAAAGCRPRGADADPRLPREQARRRVRARRPGLRRGAPRRGQAPEVVVHLAGTTMGDDVKARHVVEAAPRGTPADAGWSSRYGSSAGPPDLSEPGRIWPRTGLWATAPGSSSWLGGWAHQPLAGRGRVSRPRLPAAQLTPWPGSNGQTMEVKWSQLF